MTNEFEFGAFPSVRPRRMRRSEILRGLMRETRISSDGLIMPYFVREGRNVREDIPSMPGQFRFSCDTLLQETEDLIASGVRSVLLFGIHSRKDEQGSAAYAKDGVVQKAVQSLKKEFGNDLLVITDVCLCASMSHGHCGALNNKGIIDNDASLKILSLMALSHAEAGADMVAPSDMMDGRVAAIRRGLDQNGFSDIPILSYAAKFASAFYGPFRDAAHSAPQSGQSGHIPKDRKTYQMDFSNIEEALREIALDIREGADMVMVKPGLAYLDVLREAWNRFRFPLAVYAVSGEYAMIKAASEKGWLDEKQAVLETTTAFFRAGASSVITYYAPRIALWLREESSLRSPSPSL